jgi:hypothetical protein
VVKRLSSIAEVLASIPPLLMAVSLVVPHLSAIDYGAKIPYEE